MKKRRETETDKKGDILRDEQQKKHTHLDIGRGILYKENRLRQR